MLEVVSCIVFIIYASLVFGATWYLANSDNSQQSLNNTQLFSVSVIIPFRNEKHQLSRLMDHLRSQRYEGKVEFIFADDHSEDGSDEIVRNGFFPGVVYLPSDSGETGKKAAITRAIAVATGDIILMTDADCMQGPQWVQSMVEPFLFPEIQMVLGPVALSQHNLFSRLQATEFLSIMAVTRLSAALQKPLMANGANLAYRKEIFEKLSGYSGNEQITSGDDEFLLNKTKKNFINAVRFVSNSHALVIAEPASHLNEFVSQRVRWAGKWKYNPDFASRALAVSVFCIQIITITILVDLFFDPAYWHLILVVKIFPEYFLLKLTSGHLNSSFRLKDFLTVSLIYPFYVVGIALGTLWLKPQWKGRPVKS